MPERSRAGEVGVVLGAEDRRESHGLAPVRAG